MYLDDCEDRAQRNTNHKYEQEYAMGSGVSLGVEDGEEDESNTANERAYNREGAEDAFASAEMGIQSASGVSWVPVCFSKGEVAHLPE